MTIRRVSFAFALAAAVAAAACAGPTPAAPPAAANPSEVHATLVQLMRAIPFPNSNIVFDVQDNDPATKPPDQAGPYIGTYQGWEGVENAALALAETANLILLPGRKCSNGQDVPLNQPDFVEAAKAMRGTGMTIYEAAKKKDMAAVAALSDRLTETCANCHDKYRPDSRIGGPKISADKRCMPGV